MIVDRIKVLMVCAHEPTIDPRIRWEAEAAARQFDVTVLGFNKSDLSCAPSELRDGYKIVRLPQREVTALSYFWRLKDIAPDWSLVPGAILAVVLVPTIIMADLVVRASLHLKRMASELSDQSSLPLPGARLLRKHLGGIRGLLLTRVHHILAVLQLQFAPALSAFWEYLRYAPDKPDVIHCNDLDTLLVGVLAKRRYGCRLIFDAHEFYPHSDPSGRWIDIRFFSMLERFLIRQADAVITVNPLLAEAVRDAYRLAEVHAAANAEPWVGMRARPVGSKMEELARDRVKFLFQGRFASGRGIEEVILAWTKVDCDRAALFLRGPDNLWRKSAIRLAAELGLLDRCVYFLDPVAVDQLVAAAAEADVGIIPYRPLIINDRLSCPNKLSQYLHAGLMIIAGDLTYVKSVLIEARAGVFYDSTEPGTLAGVVHCILEDREMLRQSRENALRYARERFNWQIEGGKLYALYLAPRRELDTIRDAIVAPALQ